MSGILGVFDLARRPVDAAQAHRMARRQAWRGGPASAQVEADSAVVAVSRYDWERAPGLSGDALVLDDGRYLLAADASIYYRDDLLRQLAAAGVEPAGDTASHWILAAFRAWGTDCAQYLEGNFAFIVYDRETRQVFCARDFTGMRPLYYARLGDVLVVASTTCAILEHADCPAELNIAPIGAAVAGWFVACGADTAFEAVQVVPMAGSMAWSGDTFRSWRHWNPPAVDTGRAVPFEDAAVELRELLARAVSERLAAKGNTAVWMSGGRDSTAVFAAGRYALRRRTGDPRHVVPVSISYPEGDLGREDDYIRAVADRWDAPPHWIDIDTIAMFERAEERAATRDEPGTSPYENWNVALARGARACDAHVALDGNGGDQLFRTLDIYLSDLLRRGHWIELARELRAKRSLGRRHLFEMTVLPLVPDSVYERYQRARGSAGTRHFMQFPRPRWLRQDFVERHALAERQFEALPPRRAPHQEALLLQWYLTSPMMSYAYAVLHQRLLETGVETRAPLLDRRVVEFALGRPRPDRVRGVDEKRLLRASMRGLIPDSVLAPRPARTGITTSYSRRAMRHELPALYEALFRSPLRLAELGIVDEGELRASVGNLAAGRIGEFARIALFHTFNVELWLRARHDVGVRA